MMENEKKQMKIFVSHSKLDIAFVRPVVELFEHIGLNPENMFCSSVPGYNIPLGYNVLDYLKEQFHNFDLRVIFILSENYYKSPFCLSEMGAAWVLQNHYTSILLPQFDFKDMKGVIDQMQISIKLDSDQDELKARLNELRATLVGELKLDSSLASQNIWERHRNQFVNTVNSMDIYWKQLHLLSKNNKPYEEWISPLKKIIDVNPSSYDAMYMLGTIYAELGNVDDAIKYLNMVKRLSIDSELKNDAGGKLKALGFIL